MTEIDESMQKSKSLENRALTVAYYLPQFHAIPENDRWWGEGFTEWTNVKRALPLYDGHDQPRRSPILGEYDLTDVTVMHRQAELARAHDVNAFCFYFYWFDGHRLLEKPLDNYLATGPDFPFCISWANENWTRRWDGKEHQVLIGQDYNDKTPDAIFSSFLPYLKDKRYLLVDGKPLLLIHRIDHIPDASTMIERWRQLAGEHGLGDLHVVASETRPGLDPLKFGADAVAEFPPVGSNTLSSARVLPVAGLRRDFRGRAMSYRRMARRFMKRREPSFLRYRGVAPGWDNTARRGQKATVYVGHHPELYGRWLSHARRREDMRKSEQGIVFVNAWNEWAEGAYLEPDATWGDAYLKATRRTWVPGALPQEPPASYPSGPWMRSLALAVSGSLLAAIRKLRGGL